MPQPHLPAILLALISFHGLLSPSVVTGLRIYKDRQSLLNILIVNGESVEERLYLEFCKHSSSVGSCNLAIDGDIINEWTQCAASEVEDVGWWKAQLEIPSYITRVVIHTVELPDSDMQNGLNDFALMASEIQCYRHISTEKFESKSFPCDALGDQIIIQSYRANSVLALCEVEVFGTPLTFQGLEAGAMEIDFQNCDQSSTLGSSTCDRAVDRMFLQRPDPNTGKLCAETDVENNPWWAVYFSVPALVKNVKVYGRLDCCPEDLSDFVIKVNEVECSRHRESAALNTKIFSCERFGSFLHVVSQKENAKLSLCQVQVFGHKMFILADTLYNNLGCFKDNADDPDFELQVASTWMSPRKCHRMCKRQNKVYFGLQNGQVCMCGNKYGRHGRTPGPVNNCTMACKDDPNSICGGPGVNSVYEIVL